MYITHGVSLKINNTLVLSTELRAVFLILSNPSVHSLQIPPFSPSPLAEYHPKFRVCHSLTCIVLPDRLWSLINTLFSLESFLDFY